MTRHPWRIVAALGVGLESGRNILRGCPDHRVDLATARDIRAGGNRRVQFRLDIFNAFNTVIINGRNNTVTYVSPTNLTVVNSQYRADGSLDPARLTPRTAGFGAATPAMDMRQCASADSIVLLEATDDADGVQAKGV